MSWGHDSDFCSSSWSRWQGRDPLRTIGNLQSSIGWRKHRKSLIACHQPSDRTGYSWKRVRASQCYLRYEFKCTRLTRKCGADSAQQGGESRQKGRGLIGLGDERPASSRGRAFASACGALERQALPQAAAQGCLPAKIITVSPSPHYPLLGLCTYLIGFSMP